MVPTRVLSRLRLLVPYERHEVLVLGSVPVTRDSQMLHILFVVAETASRAISMEDPEAGSQMEWPFRVRRLVEKGYSSPRIFRYITTLASFVDFLRVDRLRSNVGFANDTSLEASVVEDLGERLNVIVSPEVIPTVRKPVLAVLAGVKTGIYR